MLYAEASTARPKADHTVTGSGRSITCHDDMAHSLASECTPLKHAYDSCFNAWFAGYLEPTLTSHQQREKDKNPQEYQKRKAEEYQQKCGKVWESYRECVQVSCLPRFPACFQFVPSETSSMFIPPLTVLLAFLESDQR
jgi:hypothetical protein